MPPSSVLLNSTVTLPPQMEHLVISSFECRGRETVMEGSPLEKRLDSTLANSEPKLLRCGNLVVSRELDRLSIFSMGLALRRSLREKLHSPGTNRNPHEWRHDVVWGFSGTRLQGGRPGH